MTDHAPLTDEHNHEWTAWSRVTSPTYPPGHRFRACRCGVREIEGPTDEETKRRQASSITITQYSPPVPHPDFGAG